MSQTLEQLKGLKLIGGVVCLDFANTDELLEDYDDLLAWALQAEAIDESQADRLRRRGNSAPNRARAAFDRAVSLRETIRRIFSSQVRGDSALERDLARLSTAVGRFAKHLKLQPSPEGFTWRWHNMEDQLDWPTWIVARSAAELLTSGQRSRVRECASDDCRWLFIDTSRNRSRRWCDMAECGNRAKARRNYARKRRSASEARDGESA